MTEPLIPYRSGCPKCGEHGHGDCYEAGVKDAEARIREIVREEIRAALADWAVHSQSAEEEHIAFTDALFRLIDGHPWPKQVADRRYRDA